MGVLNDTMDLIEQDYGSDEDDEEQDMKEETVQWTHKGTTYYSCGKTSKQLPSGKYRGMKTQFGEHTFTELTTETDELLKFDESLPGRILAEIESFWTKEHLFKKFGFMHKRGYLLYGKHGTGKTSLVNIIAKGTIANGNLVLECERPGHITSCAKHIRELEPNRPIVCVFEDIDGIIDNYGDQELLQWLDGRDQINKVVNIATTNFPQNLDKRFIARPRRFDQVVRINPPDAAIREAYFKIKLPDQPEAERKHWVTLTENLTFAALSELIICVYCLDNKVENVVKRLKELDSDKNDFEEFEKYIAT